MQSINCFIIVVKVLLHLIIKKLMFSFLDSTIAVCKFHNHSRAFAADVAKNTAEFI